ncbi:MAG TPA: hypothetical protein VKM35_08520 [Arenimonas sp.]|uniref:hypothetical protein n=1 Tax=Arenimonas sp. TaxID=1872635 RepID=UPI002CE2EF94|nr:hypothetical protein [Arenimonas sp.]HMB57242.1 hypothetical protein [Arenimonas sp.]
MATPDLTVQTLQAQLEQARQDVEDAEHARDAANLARMKVAGQLNTLQKALAAAAPEGSDAKDAQQAALARIGWLATHGTLDPAAATAAKEAEMTAPMPSRAVLEAVIAGTRSFTKEQLEFSVGEVMVLTGWQLTPIELIENGEVWMAEQVLKNQGAASE